MPRPSPISGEANRRAASGVIPLASNHNASRSRQEGEGAKYGISFGTVLAIAISYTNNHSVLWAIIHGFFSWLYVIYYVLFK